MAKGGESVSFGALLRRYRGARGLTQDELAGRAGLNVYAISMLERGVRREPRGTTVAFLAEALRLDASERAAFEAAAMRTSRTLPSVTIPTEIRAPGTALIGRQQEFVYAGNLLARPAVRLVTLTGPPGSGKTRLAIELASELAGEYRDGVVIVALSPLADPALVMAALRQAMGLREAANETPLDTVARRCRELEMLLVLDNFEQLPNAAVDLVELLNRCRNVQALVTSRAALRVRMEHEMVLPPLQIPSAEEERAGDPEALREVPSVSLFTERAEAAVPGFRLSTANATPVAAICRRLDGLPLALELAAPWLRLLAPAELLLRLDRRLELLVDGPRDLPDRQRTLRAAIDWSCGLLADEPRMLLRRLSVFAGGAPLDAVEAVCQAAGTLHGGVLPALGVLVDHSLVQSFLADELELRTTMLESLREHAMESLLDADELEATARAHLEYYTELADGMTNHAQESWLNQMRREHENVRAALAWAAEHGHAEAGLRLAARMRPFWDVGAHRREGLSWLGRLLALAASVEPHVRAEALNASGLLAWPLGLHDQSMTYLRESAMIFEGLGDWRGVAQAVGGLGNVAGNRGNHREAIPLVERSVELLRRLDEPLLLANALKNLGVYVSRNGDRRRATALYEEALAIFRDRDDALGMSLCLTNLGHQAQVTGDLRLAQDRLEEAVVAGRRLEAPFCLAAAQFNLGDVFRSRGEVATACACYRECVVLFARLGDKVGVAGGLRCLAWGAWAAGELMRAARLYGAAEGLCPARVGYDVDDEAFHERVCSALREQVGTEGFAAAFEAGGRLSLESAIAEG
jgi:predicted ATPase/transcriptional regulator with XRE-family HTH domain